MRSANLSAPLQGLRLYQALLGLSQAAGLASGFDSSTYRKDPEPCADGATCVQAPACTIFLSRLI